MLKTSDSRTEAFLELFAESRRALHRYIRRFVRSGETAKDIAQEAFLRTYRERESVITPRAFSFPPRATWRQTRSAIDARWSATRWRVPMTCSGGLNTSRRSWALLRDERNRLVQQAIDRLPAQCRAAFTLRVFHEYSYKEVADHLGISVKTVEKHISRGMRETNRSSGHDTA